MTLGSGFDHSRESTTLPRHQPGRGRLRRTAASLSAPAFAGVLPPADTAPFLGLKGAGWDPGFAEWRIEFAPPVRTVTVR
ncbi:hypothetical protein M2157_000496 [Streptomyces sp. SAI-127]|nr:hypothetical protein [Streptomyces sp. SAI-127]